MFNRRFIREKVIQTLYAFYQGGIQDGKICEKDLLHNLKKVYDLYIYHLSFIVSLSDFFQDRLDLAKKKFIPTEADLNPNTHFPHNRLIQQIRECPRFQLPNKACKFSWHQKEDLLKRLHKEVTTCTFYQEYTSLPDCFENDQVFLQKLYKKKLAPDAAFRSLCEDNSLAWAANYESVAYWVYASLKKATEDSDEWIPENFTLDGDKENEETIFGRKLLDLTLLHGDEYEPLIFEYLENWDSERLALMDVIILKTAIAELINFPSIPVNVSLNEYVEVSKRFSSEKSRIFVNGILNRVCEELKTRQLIKKTGRGLI